MESTFNSHATFGVKKDPMEVDTSDTMKALKSLNEVPKDDNDLPDTRFSDALLFVYEAFLRGNLAAGDEDKQMSQAAMPVICKQFGTNLPKFYIFELPVGKADKLKFVCVADHQGEFIIGRQSASKSSAKASTALALVLKLNLGERLNEKANVLKRQSDSSHTESEPQAKKSVAEKHDLAYQSSENLSPSTKYFLTITAKNAVQILNEHAIKQGLKTAVYDIVGESKGNFIGTCKIEGHEPAIGAPSDNKKLAKASAARMMLDFFVRKGSIATPSTLNISTILPPPVTFKDFVRNICYNALIDAVHKSPICAVADPMIAGCIMVNSVKREATLVSWASGSYAGPTSCNNDEVIRDCDALVLCKRGLQKVLYRELIIYSKDKDRSIFYEGDSSESSQHLKLRPSITFHFFTNHALKVNESCQHLLSTKDTFLQNPKFNSNKRLRVHNSMSTVDKIMKWNLVGVQGAILATFIEPIYIKSFVIRGKFNRGSTEAAFATRIPPMQYLPTGYIFNVPILECDEQVHSAFELNAGNYSPGDRPAVVWNAVTEEYEVLSCSSGVLINGGASSISKHGLCENIWSVWKSFRQEAPSNNYTDFKRSSADYNQTLRSLKENLVSNHFGLWVQK